MSELDTLKALLDASFKQAKEENYSLSAMDSLNYRAKNFFNHTEELYEQHPSWD